MKQNFWDKLMGSDDNAAHYMESYGEGPGCDTRTKLGTFINDGESVLDVGCGPGWNLDHFLKHGPVISDYKGIDYSRRFVRVANQRVGIRKGKLFHYGNANQLKESDLSWDVVLLQDVLEHMNGFEKPVHEALRVAKKRVCITFWHLKDMSDPHINNDGDDGYGAWYDKREWERFLDSLGYSWLLHEFYFPEYRLRHLYVINKEVKDEPYSNR